MGVLRMYDYNKLIYLDEEKCAGCNKCISNCPVIGANVGYIVAVKIWQKQSLMA